MSRVSLVVIPEPEPDTRTILIQTGFPLRPIINSVGSIDYTCGDCEFVICKGLEGASQVQNIVFRCSHCSSFNETRT